jgi:hypothetical protein
MSWNVGGCVWFHSVTYGDIVQVHSPFTADYQGSKEISFGEIE